MSFARAFHVEVLRGGMNRLLLRALPTAAEPTRVEVFFQYVQHLEIPMRFSGLTVSYSTSEERANATLVDVLQRFPECRVFRLDSGGRPVGRVVAGACMYGEDVAALGEASMFPMMG